MRWIHCSDLHLSRYLRIRDFIESLRQIKEAALQNDVKMLLISGDIYHRSHPDNFARVVFKRFVNSLVERDIKVLILLGTHDESYAGAHGLSDVNVYKLPNIVVMDKVEMYEGVANTKILAIPFTSPYKYKKPDLVKYVLERVNELKKTLTKDTYNIVTGHFTTTGARTGLGFSLEQVGELIIPIEALKDKLFDYVALGHIHKSQVLCEQPFIAYAGSIERVTFGERDNRNGFFLIDTEKNTKTFMPLQVRIMTQYEGSIKKLPSFPSGARVKIVTSDELSGSEMKKVTTDLLESGVEEVKIIVTPKSVSESVPVAESNWESALETWLDKNYSADKGNVLQELTKISKVLKNETA